MLWRVQYKKAMGLVRGTATEPDRDTAIERALKLYDNGYAVVSVGTVFPDTPTWEPGRVEAWRVRGMATRQALRGRRFGQAVLSALIEHARANGGRFLWCEARIGAISFYQRAGFATEGEPFVMEDVEHIHMWRDL